MSQKVEAAFIRRGVEWADLNAVRITLAQHTEDPAIEALPPPAQMTPEQKAFLIDRAVAWLTENAAPVQPAEPPLPRLRKLMDMVNGKTMSDLEFEARRDLTAFRDYPYFVHWDGEKPALPAGFKVAIIGAAWAGIAAAVQCQLLGIPYVLIEKQSRIGGTWARHKYPDVRVDTSSITYEHSFEKLYAWSQYFAPGDEVRAYLQHVADKHGITPNTSLSTELKAAVFDEARNVWTLELQGPDGPQKLDANILITCVGTFANAKVPDFPGKETFKGRFVHPTAWPDDLELKGKRVAIIGNGSTGVQMLKPIAAEAVQVFVFQRTPQWISPREKYGQPIEPEVAWLIQNFPGYWHWWRYTSTAPLFDLLSMQLVDKDWQAKGGHVSAANDAIRTMLTKYIQTETGGRQDLIDKLMPDYAPFSRRPVVDNGWYRALTRDNVELVTGDIARFTETGIEAADGKVREVDVVVCATGFEVEKYLMPASFTGRGGVDLHDKWESGDGPRAYLSMMVPEFPNLFMLYGPNSQPLTGGTGMPAWYALWSSFAAQCMMKMLREKKGSVEVKEGAYRRYNEALDKEAQPLIQLTKEGGIDKNYYVNAKHKRLQVNAPWGSPEFYKMFADVAWDDLVLK
jgi:4-hydroxyacetophenone monooxygenase